MDIVNAINAQNLILPTGTVKLGSLEYLVEMNGSPLNMEGLNDLPIKTVNGATIYMKDVAHVRDGFQPPDQRGPRRTRQRGVLMKHVQDRRRASTLDIVDRVQTGLRELRVFFARKPPRLDVLRTNPFSYALRFQGVMREALIAACLTAVMILVFLGNWKSTLIIAVSILHCRFSSAF